MAETHGPTMTFQAYEALALHRRVKLHAGSGSLVEYADAGEQAIGTTLAPVTATEFAAGNLAVPIRLTTAPGTVKVVAELADGFAAGAILYAAADGEVDDAAVGSAIGIAIEASTAAHDIIEMLPFNVLSTTAGTVSVATALVLAGTVEAAIEEIAVLPGHIPMDIGSWRENDGDAIAADGGILGASSEPILEYINGDTNSCLRLSWVAADVTPIVRSVSLPDDMNDGADLVIHVRAAMSNTNDTPVIDCDSYFDELDTKVEDASAAVTGTSYADYTITIAHGDIPAGAKTATFELTPAAHGSDALYVSQIKAAYTSEIVAT